MRWANEKRSELADCDMFVDNRYRNAYPVVRMKAVAWRGKEMARYRGKDGRFERCTVQKLFGIQTNEKGNKYRCSNCGDVFVPIIESGKCTKCQSTEIILIKESEVQ